LKNYNLLKLANNNLIRQNQFNKKLIKMIINGLITLTPVLPKWKNTILQNNQKYYSTINKDIKYKELIVKKYLLQEILDNLIKESSELFYNKPDNGTRAEIRKYNLMVDNIVMKINNCKDLIKDIDKQLKKKNIFIKSIKLEKEIFEKENSINNTIIKWCDKTNTFITHSSCLRSEDKSSFSKPKEALINKNKLAIILYRKPDLSIIPYQKNTKLSLIKIMDSSSKENEDFKYFMKLIDSKKIEYLNVLEWLSTLDVEFKNSEDKKNKFKHIKLIINEEDKKEIEKIELNKVSLYFEHKKELRKLCEENVVIDKRINDILVRRSENDEEKYIANVEKIYNACENKEDKYNLLMYYIKCERLKLHWLNEIMDLDKYIERIKNKNNKEWFKAPEVIRENSDIYSEKEIKKALKDTIENEINKCNNVKMLFKNKEIFRHITHDMKIGKHYLFGKEISAGMWIWIVESIINKETEKAWDNLYKDLDQVNMVKNENILKYIKDREEKDTEKEKEKETRNWENEVIKNVEFLGKYDLKRVYNKINVENFNLDEARSICTNYLNSLKLLDKEEVGKIKKKSNFLALLKNPYRLKIWKIIISWN